MKTHHSGRSTNHSMMVSCSKTITILTPLIVPVTVVSPRSHFSFTPFLASAAVGTLEFRCTTEPIRGIKHVKFAQGWADSVGELITSLYIPICVADVADFSGKQVTIEPAVPPIPDFEKDLANTPHPPKEKALYKLDYDKLVIAVGAYSASFGIPGVSFGILN